MERRIGNDPILKPFRSDWESCLEIRVGKDLLARALRVMDVLVKQFEKRGYRFFQRADSRRGGIVFEAFGEQFRLALREPTVRKAHVPTENDSKYWPPEWDHVLSGRLQLELKDGTASWAYCTIKDGKSKKIENQLTKIAVAVVQQADNARRRAAEEAVKTRQRAELERQRQEEAERRCQEEQSQAEEQQRVRLLFENAEHWRRCQNLRAFLAELHLAAQERHGTIEPGSEVSRWFAWAENVADQCDPVMAYRRESSSRAKPR
jgi:hypothetical protein